MLILKHIKSLLYKSDTVIIPGFGAFQGSYASATLDKQNNLIYPPYKKFSYNEKLTFDDGKLQNEIAESLSISKEEAEVLIKKDVAELFKKLNLNQSVALEGVGRISKNERGIYELEQDTSINYLRDAYGLKAVELPKKSGIQPAKPIVEKEVVSEVKETVTEEKPAETTPAIKEEPTVVAESPQVQTVAEERIIEENEGSGWWLLLLPLLFIGLGYLLWNFVLRDRNKDPKVAETITTTIEQPTTENKDSIAAVELNAAQHAAIQDSIKAAEEALAAQKAATTSQTDSYTPPPRPSSPKATVEADRGYYMVISSTPRKELADRKTKDLISRNLKAATLPGPKNYWRTAIWLDANQSAAKQRLNELKGAFPDGWLLNY